MYSLPNAVCRSSMLKMTVFISVGRVEKVFESVGKCFLFQPIRAPHALSPRLARARSDTLLRCERRERGPWRHRRCSGGDRRPLLTETHNTHTHTHTHTERHTHTRGWHGSEFSNLSRPTPTKIDLFPSQSHEKTGGKSRPVPLPEEWLPFPPTPVLLFFFFLPKSVNYSKNIVQVTACQ